MKFLDEVTIDVRSGAGGDGMAHFHREKFVPRGGPDGGDGGDGGSVILRAESGRNTLLHLRYNPLHRAEAGRPGGTNHRTGRRGRDVVIPVPVGTTVRESGSDAVIADLVEDGQTWVAAAGGRGGRGNARFSSSTNRTPQEAERGGESVARRLALELRLLADVGIVGLPNAGKSTLVSRISAARPRVADYPFTTLEPTLGVVRHGEYGSFVVTDLPGLIEGAHEGHGLGHRFLRHTERTTVLLHLVSVEPGLDPGDPVERYRLIHREIAAYDADLAARPTLVGLSKIDTVADRRALAADVRRMEEATGHEVLALSAVSGEGVDRVVEVLGDLVTRRKEETS